MANKFAIAFGRLVPQSLRGQFHLALSTLALLILAGSVTALSALRASDSAIGQLADERLVRMQDAQDMLQHTLLIERETYQLLNAASADGLRADYADIGKQLRALDLLVEKLAAANDDAVVLDLQQSAQLFRNTAHVVAQLRESNLQSEAAIADAVRARTRQLQASGRQAGTVLAGFLFALQSTERSDDVAPLRASFARAAASAGHLPGASPAEPGTPDLFAMKIALIDQHQVLQRFHDELQNQAQAMVLAARSQSDVFTREYREGVQRLVDESTRNQRWVVVILSSSLLLAWLVTHFLIGHHVLNRLGQISVHLRQEQTENVVLPTPLTQGRDEIGDMARAVEQFLKDRNLLAKKTSELNLVKERLAGQNILLQEEVVVRLQTEKELRSLTMEQQTLIEKLQQTQAQLLQSEKMASIGQLAAGIAHEINNPVGFVNSNMGTLRNYVATLLNVIAEYEKIIQKVSLNAAAVITSATQIKEDADLDFLQEDIVQLIRESMEGLTRVKEIVQSLKDYSRVGETSWQYADLHQGLNSTLTIAGNEFKHKASIEKAYGVLPPVKCVAPELNQVFMNLIVNASQAIKDTGVITIRTGCENDWVKIEICDSGEGIPAENLTRIFEPFFTTKPVGKGTGLGLSLSYNIIAKHGGRIEVESEVGKGTCFVIHLPVNGPS